MNSPAPADPQAGAPQRVVTTLQGSLDAFPVRDVLALLHGSSKSGRLVVRPAQPIWMLLSAGRAVFGGQSSAMVLGRYLLARGALSAEQLESAFSLSDATVLASLGPIDILDRLASLVDTGELDANELQLAIADACVSTVLDLLTLPERDDRGDAVAMVFSEHDVTVTTVRFSLPLDEVVAEAELQLVALEAAQQKLGGLDARLRRMRRISKSDAPATLDAQEWAALAEMDDRATIAQLAHRLGLGTGRTYELLERLLDRGLIEPA